tara:strand:- start:1001 stop:1792 length:792 start_codon:yes stop_codon:yes gene_type:complete
MKKYLVIGNPIDHSLSPRLHNYWLEKNNINGTYEKKKINEEEVKDIISEVRNNKISGLNVTIPYKKIVIPYLDELSSEAKESQSVNTISKKNDKIIGHNTDISGFELAIRSINFDTKNKKIFILGAGGVVSSIIIALKRLNVSKIILSNRTLAKAEKIRDSFTNIQIVKWGEVPDFDMIINATSLGLKGFGELEFDNLKVGPNKFFYDIIYNPTKTKFLKNADLNGNRIENGKMMFIYQAHQAFTLWNKKIPKIDKEVIKLLD